MRSDGPYKKIYMDLWMRMEQMHIEIMERAAQMHLWAEQPGRKLDTAQITRTAANW